MAKEIKQKIVLEGEKEYSASIKSAQNNLKRLQAQMKAETAELGKNATEQQKNEVKSKSLQKQIEEQEKVVKTLTEALEEAEEKYADNEDVIAEWEIKLNKARTTLANLKNDLEDTGDSGKRSALEMKAIADSLGKISSIGDSVSNAIGNAFTGMIDTVRSAVESVWSIISDTAAKANNWTDLGSYYGSDAAAMQKWATSIQAAQGSFSDFVNLINTFSFGGKEKKIAEWFGVSDANYTDNLEYTVAVLGEMAKRKEEMMAGGTWDSAMSDIFGAKKSQSASWFISNWDTILEKQQSLEEHGFLMGEDDLASLNDVWVKIGEIETKWESLKSLMAGGLGTVSLDILTNVSGALDAIGDLMQAETPEEEQAALDALTENITEAMTKAAEAIEKGLEVLQNVGEKFSGSENPYIRAIGELLQSITNALQWMIDNQEAVKAAAEAIFGVFLVGKVASAAGKLAEMAANIKVLQGFNGFNFGGNGGGGTNVTPNITGTGSGGSGGNTATSAGAGAIIGKVITSTAAKVLGAGAAFVGTLFKEAYSNKGSRSDDIFDEYGNLTEAAKKSGFYLDDTGNVKNDGGILTLETGTAEPSIVAELDPEDVEKYTQNADEPEEPNIVVELDPEEVEKYNPKVDVTQAQKDATEALWDAWRAWEQNPEDAEEEAFDQAWEQFEEAYAGETEAFEKVNQMLDELMEKTSGSDFAGMDDLPSSWWNNTGFNTDNLVTRGDLNSFQSYLGGLSAAVQKGAENGVSGIRVYLDGVTVGRLVAPYVSQNIAYMIN